jgi:serine/threonine protein kinase
VPEECPQAIADLYQACLAYDPRQRPTAAQVMEIIESNMPPGWQP